MRLKPAILLDSNAGAPLHPLVKEALFAFLGSERSTGNPSSTHSFGRAASGLMAEVKTAILKTFQASPAEWDVTFTASGTEANQLAVRSTLFARLEQGKVPVWAVSEIEHACNLDLIPEMKRAGVDVRMLKPSAEGEVRDFASAEGADLVSVIGVGNETGILHHILTSHILGVQTHPKTPRTLLHIDHVAGWGKSSIDLSADGAPDFVAISGHKLGAPSGIGALIHRKTIAVERKGTPNMAGIVSLKAIAEHWADVAGEIAGLGALRDFFELELKKRFPKVRITGEGLPRAPHVSHFFFPELTKDLSLVAKLDLLGFGVSSGSACASGTPKPSHVLTAMGIPDLQARNALRVSLHPQITAADLTAFLDALAAVLKRNELQS